MKTSAYTSTISRPENLTEQEVLRWAEIIDKTPSLQRAFLTHTFAQTVSVVHPHVWVCIVRQGKKIVCIIPFQFRNLFYEKIRIAERVGGEMSDYFGIIAESNFTINEGEICKLCNLSLLQYSHLDEPQLEYGFHNDRNMREKGLLISINSSSDEYFSKLKNANNKIISDTARRNRKIQRDLGPIKFCFNVKPKEERCTVLRTLINKKRGQYQRTGVADSLRESWKQDLLHALLHNQNNHCHGILSTMYAGNTWVASHFGLQCLNRLHYWFPVYNPKLVKYSPGRLLMYSVISESPNCKTPISIIDRGAGVSKAKEDFANNEHYFLRGELFNPKLSSISFKIFQSIRWKLIPQLRS